MGNQSNRILKCASDHNQFIATQLAQLMTLVYVISTCALQKGRIEFILPDNYQAFKPDNFFYKIKVLQSSFLNLIIKNQFKYEDEVGFVSLCKASM